MASFVPSLFVFFFHLVNNWPKFAVYIFNHSTSSSLEELLEIKWNRPGKLKLNGRIGTFANSANDFRKRYGLIYLSVCSSLLRTWQNTTIENFEWTILDQYNNQQHFQWITQECQTSWIAPEQASYIVKVSVKLIDHRIRHGITRIKIRDYWIAVIGDSFASGEGNPDIPVNAYDKAMAKWLSNQCHRSSRSWAYKAYEQVSNEILDQDAIHFTYLPCTGASVDSGILVHFNRTSQINVLEQITLIRGSGPDLLMMSVGGNDIGYSEILSTLTSDPTNSLFATIDMRFFYTSHQLDRVARAIKKLNPKQIIIPHYFDLTRNEHGLVDANCPDMRQISTENLMLAEKKILQRINRLITKKSKQYGWTAIEGVTELFRLRGCCSSNSLIRSIRDSIRLQGDSFGAFHPIEEGHQQIADLIVKNVQQFYN